MTSTTDSTTSTTAETGTPDAPDAPEEREPMRFDATDLDPALVEALKAKGIETAFPIQELTLEMGMRGQDIIGQARTGTGKTLGFGLPLLHRIDPDKKYIQALIVAPTRELTAQVAEDLQIGSARGLHVTAIYGGVPIDPQFDELKKAHVVVGTPGRLLDHLNRGTMDLSRVSELVLDEADEMLDMGFLPDVERLMAACPDDRHTSLFSATMAPAIVSLARRYMNSPSFLHAKSDEPQTAELVDQHFFQVHRMDKPRLLARLMQQPGREGCYVFTRTKAMADRLVTELGDLGVSAIAIHGDLRQSTREKNLDKFRDGKASILVATEVAARGLDVDNVTHVVNYDCPDDDKMYLHRIGRTARAGRSGVAITFAEHNEVDRLNVIRKAVGAFDGELKQVFSTSPELQEIFELPDETPWDHLARSRSGSKGSGSRDSRSKDSSRGAKDSSSRGSSSRGRSDDRGRDGDDDRRDRSSSNGRSSSKGRSSSNDRSSSKGGDDRARGDRARDDRARDDRARDDRAEAKGSDDARERSRSRDDEDRPTRKPRDRNRGRDADTGGDEREAPRGRDDRNERNERNDRDGGDDGRTRTRTRTRTRAGGDDAEGDRGRTRARAPKDDDAPRGDSRQRSRDDQRDDRDDESRPRARRRARGGRGRGGGSGDGGSGQRGDDRQRNRSDRDDRNDRDDRSDRGGRGGRDQSGRDQSGRGRSSNGSGRSSSDDDNGSGRSGGSRNGSKGGGRNSRSNRSSSSSRQSSSSGRQPARTTAERRTRRGDDARGDGQPRLARRVEVEHLP